MVAGTEDLIYLETLIPEQLDLYYEQIFTIRQ